MGKLLYCIQDTFFFFWLALALCHPTLSPNTLNFLPGFDGPLPFQLETGYVGVDESEDVQLFYYFVKSESNPNEDPLILWLTGGPGCTSFTGLAFEIGPITFDTTKNDGSFPTLVKKPYSWSKVANIIFLDLPVGTGFSYGRTMTASHSSDLQACHQAFEFLKKWLISHQEFSSNPVYIGGDSYSGETVPVIAQLISNGIEINTEPYINLKGYLLGNPRTHPGEDNYRIPFAHGMALISDELYESLQRNCQGEYVNIDSNNTLCLQDMDAFKKCTNGLSSPHILEPVCDLASPKPHNLFDRRRSIQEEVINLIDTKASPCPDTRTIGYKLSSVWFNNKRVQKALGVREGTVTKWWRCNFKLNYKVTNMNALLYHVNLSTKGYRSLVYSGDHDMVVPFLATQAWIRSLNYSIVDHWHRWIVEGQVAGFTRCYSNKMTFATVKGAGHTAPEYKPRECFAMIKRWLSHQPL